MPMKQYVIKEDEKENLLKKFPPKYPDVKADHITHEFSLVLNNETGALPPSAHSAEIIGMVDDNKGLQAMLVKINGSLERKDGDSIYHLTWSLNSGAEAPSEFTENSTNKKYQPVHSNNLVKSLIDKDGNILKPDNSEWTVEIFDKPIPINPEPKTKFFPSEVLQMAAAANSRR